MGVIASQITSLTIVYSTVYSDADQRKHHSSAWLALVRGIDQGPVNSPHKWPVTRKMFPFADVIMSNNMWPTKVERGAHLVHWSGRFKAECLTGWEHINKHICISQCWDGTNNRNPTYEGPGLTNLTELIPWLLMICWCKERDHWLPWYWPKWTRIFWLQHQKG